LKLGLPCEGPGFKGFPRIDGRSGVGAEKGRPKFSWLRRNQGAGIILASLFTALLVYILLTPWAHRKLRDGFTLGFFPALAVSLSIIFSLIMIFDSHRREVLTSLEGISLKSSLGVVLAVLVSWVYFAAMRKIGFLIATPFFLLVAMYVLGLKPLRNVLIAAVSMTAIVYAIFRVMGIELPSGKLAGILPF